MYIYFSCVSHNDGHYLKREYQQQKQDTPTDIIQQDRELSQSDGSGTVYIQTYW